MDFWNINSWYNNFLSGNFNPYSYIFIPFYSSNDRTYPVLILFIEDILVVKKSTIYFVDFLNYKKYIIKLTVILFINYLY